jgi:HSP20 family protein
MKIIRSNPIFAQSSGLSNLVDDFFNRNFSDLIGTDFVLSRPSVNVSESDKSYDIEMAAPGLEKSDFQVKIENGHLVVSADKSNKSEETKENYTRREFNYSSFKRSFALPENVNIQGIEAGYDKGVLRISIPKNHNEANTNAQKIEIK